VTLGCIRLYPEHIKGLYERVNVGTKVRLIYEPVKIGFRGGEIYVEAHPDRYNKKKNLFKEVLAKLDSMGIYYHLDEAELSRIIYAHDGIPHRVGFVKGIYDKKGGGR
jgi:L,D-transpeptidase ErfK/SrfK